MTLQISFLNRITFLQRKNKFASEIGNKLSYILRYTSIYTSRYF